MISNFRSKRGPNSKECYSIMKPLKNEKNLSRFEKDVIGRCSAWECWVCSSES